VRVALDWFGTGIPFAADPRGILLGAAVGLRVACPDPRVQAVIDWGCASSLTNGCIEFAFLGSAISEAICQRGTRSVLVPG